MVIAKKTIVRGIGGPETMAQSIEGIRTEMTEVRQRTIENSSTLNTLREAVQNMATNVATLTQTVLGNDQIRKSEMDFVRDNLEVVKDSQKRIQALEVWKAEQTSSKSTAIALVLASASTLGFLVTVAIALWHK